MCSGLTNNSLPSSKTGCKEKFKYSLTLSLGMEEIKIKVDIPAEFKQEFKLALAKVVKSLVEQIEFSIAKDIVSKSKFREQDADELANKVKSSVHKRYKKLYPELQ